ncbi:WD40 repeat-like protein [Coprinellus micaceus]|uniref:WD40 repeat-like protein n=1 Tax=Coprinellus micaceus TaxID=71717 RepID=A0A4Y7T1T0_COPMI|nr:WD40 repeat-like protein [Coprinellus micaceus]
MYFQQIHSLRGAHKRRVRWLQFSPKGAKLACADEEGLTSVWDVETGTLICTFELGGCISVLAWDVRKAERLFIGLESGVVRVVDSFKTPGVSVKTGVKGAPVHAIAPSPSGCLAIAIGAEVHITHQSRQGVWITVDILPQPKLPGETSLGDTRVRPRSLHFYRGSRRLIVSYLNHGVVCYDLDTLLQLWDISPSQENPTMYVSKYESTFAIHADLNTAVYSTLFPRLSILAATNMSTGAMTYSINSRRLAGHLDMPLQADRNVPCVAGSLDFSSRMACGGHTGSVCIWDIPSNELIQSLKYDDNSLIQCIASQSYLNTEYVASAPVEGEPIIKLWKATIPASTLERLSYRLSAVMDGERLWMYFASCMLVVTAVVFQMLNRSAMSDLSTYIVGVLGWAIKEFVYDPLLEVLEEARRRLREWLLNWLGVQPTPPPPPSALTRLYPLWRPNA